MDSIGKVYSYTVDIFGLSFSVNPVNIMMTWVVIGLMVILCAWLTKGLKKVPGNKQNIAELLFQFIDDLTLSSLGKKSGGKFVPFVFMIFTFTLIANWIGIVPNIAKFIGMIFGTVDYMLGNENIELVVSSWNTINLNFSEGFNGFYKFLLKSPGLVEPTRSVNTDLAMALMVFIVVHVNSIRRKGTIEYLKQYWGDAFPCKGKWLFLAPVNFFIVMNIISEISSVVSHSFRLFGNIFGGFLIFTIVSSLINHLIIPVGLLAFFGLFSGLIQAFVFTMLTITYITMKA